MSIVNGRWVWPQVPKKVWGNAGWNWLHRRAIRYPERPTKMDMEEAYADVLKFLSELPCEECRGHALKYFNTVRPDLTDTWSFQSWVWTFHNNVNIRLGKPVMQFDAYMREYADEISQRHRM